MYNIIFGAVLVASTSAFTSPVRHTLSRNSVPSISIPTRSNNVLQMADGSDDNTPRKRRKRKDGQQFSPPSASVTITEKKDDIVEVVEIEAEEEDVQDTQTTTPKENVVVMQVRDIQDVVNGAPETPKVIEEKVTLKREEVFDDDDDDDDDELADDEEWEYYDVDEDGNEIIVSEEQQQYNGRGSQDESIEQLLADARSMRKSSSKGLEVVDEETPLKEKILGVVANIVTVDFFVVIALLLWFLAGIFCSYVLKDDTVQIAFNMNFERVTQP